MNNPYDPDPDSDPTANPDPSDPRDPRDPYSLSEQDIENYQPSFGPSTARVTHAPISFDKQPADIGGIYYPDYAGLPKLLDRVYSKVPGVNTLISKTSPGIHVDPDPAKGSWENTIRHESIHSLLQPAYGDQGLAQLAQENPYFKEAATAPKFDYGYPPVELPAWLGSGDQQRLGVPNPLSRKYTEYLAGQLARKDPKLAEKFMRLGVPNPKRGNNAQDK